MKMSYGKEKKMMKRSDFAQKLLDDLRVRKERLTSSQNSSNAPAGKYTYSNRGFKGTKEINAKNTYHPGLSSYGGGSKSAMRVEDSNQIVPFGRGRSSEKMDLSKALAFALENAGKASRTDPPGSTSIISFLQQVGNRSLGYGGRERRSSQGVRHQSSIQVPMIHVHIKEVSKGAQKLNQIIKACSNRLGFGNGRYSIEYGKELMQGAIELEQSLRILVNMQEASEYTTRSKRTNRIKVLDDNGEEDDDDDDDNDMQMQLEVPYRNYQNIKEVARDNITMRLSTLSYGNQTPKGSTQASQRRSATCNEAGLSTVTVKDTSNNGTGRIPNVIAKLMGLGECPEVEDNEWKRHKESNSKTDKSIKSGMNAARKEADQGRKSTRRMENQSNRKTVNIDLDSVMYDETHADSDVRDKTKNQRIYWGKERAKDDDNKRRNNAVKGELRNNRRKPEPDPMLQKSVHLEARREDKWCKEKEKLQRRRQKEDVSVDAKKKLSLTNKSMLHKQYSYEANGGLNINRSASGSHKTRPKEERIHFGHVNGEDLKQKPAEISARKAKEVNEHKGKIPQKINRARREERLNKLMKLPKNQNSVSKEETHIKRELHRGYKDTNQISSNGTELTEEMTKTSEVSLSDIQSWDNNVANDQGKITNRSQILKEVHAQAVPKPLRGVKDEMEQQFGSREIVETLSESEIHLKKIIHKSNLFLDTAEALFKLSIPLDVLHEGGNGNNQDDSKLILDCGYELMKRKGRLQELSIHPFVKLSISSSKVKSLDDLIKQLSKEFEKLRSYGKECCTEPPLVEAYLPKILERDVFYKDLELNSMWDMGWSDSMLAFIERDDVIKNIERYVFDELVEEITRGLKCI